MSAFFVTPPWPAWARATVILLATLAAHAALLDRVERMLIGEQAAPARPMATVSGRLLPPAAKAPIVMPPAKPPPARRARPTPQQRPSSTPAAPLAPVVVAEAAPQSPALEVPTAATPAEAEPVAESAAPTAVALNAERPIEPGTATDAIEFEAAGPGLRAVLASVAAPKAMLPVAARYVYRTANSDLRLASGTTTVDWALAEDGRYRLRLETTTIGMTLLELNSQGSVQAFGLAPERYVETRIRRGAVAANFDWDGRRVTFSARAHEQPLTDGVQDRVSFQFQLMLLGQALPERFRAGQQTVLRIASRDEVASYRLRSAGRERTMTGLGELDTVKVERVVERETDGRIEVWLAPDHGWLPARLRFTDRHGRITDSVLESMGTP